jgi:outer membrane protein OmpA-like peptidoglycan-associated protein
MGWSANNSSVLEFICCWNDEFGIDNTTGGMMRKTIGFLFGLVVMLLAGQPGLCQETFDIQKPEQAADFSYQVIAPGKLLISASDSEGRPLRGLTARDFVFLRKGKPARILGVETLETSQDVGLNIVLVVDNSASMKQRRAVESILDAMENIYKIMRPIDNITMIVFNDDETQDFDGQQLHVTVKQSNQPGELRAFLKESFDSGMTAKTVLYEGMLAGLDLIRQMPEESHKFMVVFTDGEDINSAYPEVDVKKAAEGISKLEVYGIDYMPGGGMDPFLSSFSQENSGRVWKATTAAELGPIFEAVSSKLLYRYVVDYQFLFPPTGSFTMATNTMRIEEITTIDSSPLLNYVYFAEGDSAIAQRYIRFQEQGQTQAFSEEPLRGTKEKYANLLNIVGLRMRNNPEATITLVGCNSNHGDEKGRKELSRARAEGVKAYLQYIWGIEPARMAVEARNLPEVPTSGRSVEGHEENQRVEIHSDDDMILDVVRSTYVEAHSNVKDLIVMPMISSEHGIDRWRVFVEGDGQLIFSQEGTGAPEEKMVLKDKALTPTALSQYAQLTAAIEVEDIEGQTLTLAAEPMTIEFIQREAQRARNMGYRVQEKYALILFDFDSDKIKERNASVVETIVARIRQFPAATVAIVGHTDNIGKEEYNLQLSERRAKAVYEQITKALGETAQESITQMGVGPFDPLYGNGLPENRALNRTVTVMLEYEQKE